jgi:predicted glycosyltransferase involved in capsule biosynthesis
LIYDPGIKRSHLRSLVSPNKQAFVDCGMENEFFVTWGLEDIERVIRWRKLDKTIGRVSGDLYHLDHETYSNTASDDNKKEYDKVKNMSKDQLAEYMKTWEWLK